VRTLEVPGKLGYTAHEIAALRVSCVV